MQQPSQQQNTCTGCQRPLGARSGLCRECQADRRRQRVRLGVWLTSLAVVAAGLAWTWQAYLAPWLDEYRSKQHLAHATARVAEAQEAVTAVYERTGFLPNTNLDAKLPGADQLGDDIVASIRVGSSAQITLTLQPQLPLVGGKTLIFLPEKHPRHVLKWRCEGGTLPAARRPQSCVHKLVLSRPDDTHAVDLDEIKELATTLPAAGSSDDPLARRKQVALDEISDIIADSRKLRLKMMVYYTSAGGEWPASNAYLDLPPPNRLGGGNIQSVKVTAAGRIEYRFSGGAPGLEGHRFWLQAGGLGQWKCGATLPGDHLPPACDGPIQ
ncbi:MAG: pilin [Alcanivoracaceae bacterium]|nr:pilin [Alcanivoracaceae bacterium]